MADDADQNPFGDLASSDENPFGSLANDPIQNVRSGQFNELYDNPDLVRDLFSLTKNEVGSQGPEAQQAFIETVFNRAASRGQSLDDVVHDRNYYPQVSLRGANLSDDEIDNYGGLLRQVAAGSNISNYATGNASGSVGFNGGQQTASYGGEKFGIEGPDVPSIVQFAGGNVEASQLPGQEGGQPNPFGDFAVAPPRPSPEPLPAPSPQPDVAQQNNNALGDFLTGALPSIGEMIPRSLSQAVDMALYTPMEDAPGAIGQAYSAITHLIQTGQIPPPDPNNVLISLEVVKNQYGGGSPQYRQAAGKVAATILPQMAMAAAGVKAPTQPLNPSGEGLLGSKFRATYALDKDLGNALEALGASRESALDRSTTHLNNMLQDLDDQQVQQVGEWLNNRRMNDVNPNHPQAQTLTPRQSQQIFNDPKIRAALDYYANNIRPEIEGYRANAGLSQGAIAANPDPYFISLIPKEQPIPKQYSAGQQVSRASKRTRFAQQAEGTAPEYHTDIRKIVQESYSEALRKSRRNDFFNLARDKGLAEYVTEHGPNGPYKTLNDRSLAMVDDKPTLLNDLRAADERSVEAGSPLGGAWGKLQRGATAVALSANPAEIANHMRRQLNLLSSVPPVGRGVAARMEVLLPYIGPKAGAFIRTITDDMSSPENVAIRRDIIDAGGGSTRAFQNMFETKIPGLKQIQKRTHKLLFGMPEGRGINGWDMRMRIQLEKVRRAAEGNADPQRIRQFANQIGQYGAHTDWFIDGFRKINPYAATTLPMRLTEMQRAIGMSGLKSSSATQAMFRNLETQLRGTGGTLLGMAAANYYLSGKWPWQNDPGHEFDINLGSKDTKGNPIYLKTRVFSPELARPLNTSGLPAALRERAPDNKNPQYLAAVARSFMNQGLEILGGPAQNSLLTATTGLTLYLEKDFKTGETKLLNLTDDKNPMMGSMGVEHVARALAGLNPLGGIAFPPKYETQAQGALNYVERPLLGSRAVMPLGNMFTHGYAQQSGTSGISPITKSGKVKTQDQMVAEINRMIKRAQQKGQ